MTGINSVLAQKLGLSTPSDEGIADAAQPVRLFRRAVGRAADQALGLTATVTDVSETSCDVEGVVTSGDASWVLLGLRDPGHPGLSGLFMVDPQVRSALVDIQTMGMLLPASETPRKVTKTDAALTMPFASTLLEQMHEVNLGEGGVSLTGYDIGPIEDLRTAGLVMIQGQYLCWRLTVGLGGGDVTGEMMIVLRSMEQPDLDEGYDDQSWRAAMRAAVGEAEAEINALLCTMHLSLDEIEGLEIGQVVELTGTTVESVTLHGADGDQLATARLGQIAGKRAVRIEPHHVTLQDGPSWAQTPLPDVAVPKDVEQVEHQETLA